MTAVGQCAARSKRRTMAPGKRGEIDIGSSSRDRRSRKALHVRFLFDTPAIPDKAPRERIKRCLRGSLQHHDLYEFFLHCMPNPDREGSKDRDRLLKELDISKTQLSVWLKRQQKRKARKEESTGAYAWLSSSPNPNRLRSSDGSFSLRQLSLPPVAALLPSNYFQLVFRNLPVFPYRLSAFHGFPRGQILKLSS